MHVCEFSSGHCLFSHVSEFASYSSISILTITLALLTHLRGSPPSKLPLSVLFLYTLLKGQPSVTVLLPSSPSTLSSTLIPPVADADSYKMPTRTKSAFRMRNVALLLVMLVAVSMAGMLEGKREMRRAWWKLCRYGKGFCGFLCVPCSAGVGVLK